MKTYTKLALVFVIVGIFSAAAGALIAPFTGFTFYKVVRRSVAVFAIIGCWLFWKFYLKRPIKSLGLDLSGKQLRNLFVGLSLGVGAISIYVALAIGSGLFKVELHRFSQEFLFVAAWSLPAAIIIGIMEEFLFRGVTLQSLLVDLKMPLAVVITSAFYAIIHTKMPHQLIVMWPKLLGLFLLGIALCYGYLRSGSLFLSIGIHSGLVYAIKLRKMLFVDPPAQFEWLFGDKWLVGGALSWFAIGIIILLIRTNPFGIIAKYE